MIRRFKAFVSKYCVALILAAGFWVPICVWIVHVSSGYSSGKTFSAEVRSPLLNAHALAAIVSSATLALTIPVALASRLSRGPINRFIFLAMSLPLFMGMLARNHGWIGMMSAKTAATSLGWSFLGGNDILYTRRAVWIVMSFIFLPWTFFLLRLSLRGVTSLHVEAAASLGAGSRSIIIRLFIPAILRGGVISLLLVYCTSLGYFITPMMLGGNAYPLPGIYILKLIDLGSFDEASYLALVLLATTAPFATIFLYFIHRWRIFSI